VLGLGAFFRIPFLAPLGRALAAPVGAWLPWAAILAVAARDLAVTALRTVYERRNRPLRTTSAAKWKTAWQLTFLITVEVFLVFSHARVLGGFWEPSARSFSAFLERPIPLVFLLL